MYKIIFNHGQLHDFKIMFVHKQYYRFPNRYTKAIMLYIYIYEYIYDIYVLGMVYIHIQTYINMLLK